MTKIKSLMTGCACFVLSLLSVGVSQSLFAQNPLPVYLDESKSLDERVEDALARMTLQEKVDMCHGQAKFSSPGVPRLGIPDLWMSDGPHGVRREINWRNWGDAERTNDSITAFPALTALAATWNPSLAYDYGNALAEEALYREKDVMLGPGVNIYRTPMNGRNFEYMGEDPYLASTMVVPYIKGMQKNGVAVCVKHYALNNQELWRGHIDVNLSDRALHEIYLPAFKSAVIDGGAWSIMGSYNKIRGEHGCHNDLTLNKILKQDWAFDGVVISDWGGTHNTREAILNGLDLEMGTEGKNTPQGYTTGNNFLGDAYLKMLKSGEVPLSTLDDKVRRLLRLNFRTAMRRDKPFGSLCTPEHYAVAENIGNEAVVLLKNAKVNKKKTKVLPVLPEKATSILVVGDNAVRNLMEGGGSSELKVKDCVTPLQALIEIYGDKVKYAKGYSADGPLEGTVDEAHLKHQEDLRREAVDMAREADVVIMVGGLNKRHHLDCEDGDRFEYGLPFAQPQLINEITAVNPNFALVLLSGNAVEMPWADRVPAILQAWYLGSMSGKSIANVISGKVVPSGKLPFSFPVKLEDNAAHHFGEISYPGDSKRQEYLEDIFVGYRWHDTKKIPALFPFGHGLSYTDFEYGKVKMSSTKITSDTSIKVSIPISNVGDIDGKEVVQLYLGDDKSSLARPLKELKAFEKVSLKTGETKVVTFEIKPNDLKFYDDRQGQWIAEQGKFTVYIGSSSTDIRAKAQFTYEEK